ncbi:MAG: helix-turn-helix domain-containing protein, partial [Myxococcota bacterium]
ADMDARDEEARELCPGIFMGEVDAPMRRAVARLAELFDEDEAGRVLGDGCIRELLFHLLRGPNGPAIRRFVQVGSVEHRIYQITHRIESQLDAPIDVDALAAAAHVSRTVFYEQFKRVTSFSPLQYQKRLRLLQAQRLMVDEHMTVENAAYRVGYQSPSQFSRDYVRLFGEPPRRNATRLRNDVEAR